MNRLIVFGLGTCLVFYSQVILTQVCDPAVSSSTPSKRFIDKHNGTVRDRVTGLLWQRCVVGQVWDGSTCLEASGSQVKSWFSWHDANYYVKKIQKIPQYEGWRLPKLIEMNSIVEKRCREPAINLDIFPNSPSSFFWSSDLLATNNEYVWRMDFSNGKKGSDLKSNYSYYIRLVKGDFIKPTDSPISKKRTQELALWDDGIHDLKNQHLSFLQPMQQAVKGLPRDKLGRLDWAKALQDGVINPRASVDGKAQMHVWDNDIIYKETKEMPYVLFPHKLHSMWLACENCHSKIFAEKKNSVKMTMGTIYSGQHCGVCHGKVAFSPNICERCHSILHPGSPTKWW